MSLFYKLSVFFLIFVYGNALLALPVKPGLSGYGTSTVAGSGRHLSPVKTEIYRVTSLAASGPGTLTECVELKTPRVCIFEIAGQINFKNMLKIKSPYLTIAGQTAPKPGIVISGAGLRIMAHDILIEHIAVRVGDDPKGPDPQSRDGISIGSDKGSVYNVVIDHVSVSWALDENISTWYEGTRDITISNSIFSEALNDSIHPDGPHSKGMMIGDESKSISIYQNLLAHNFERNPYFKPGTVAEFVGNVVYNWGNRSRSNIANLSDTAKVGTPVSLNFIGNYYKPGPDSIIEPPLYGANLADMTRVYVEQNFGPGRKSNSQPEWDIANFMQKYQSKVPVVAFSGIKPKTAAESYRQVLYGSGARPVERDEIDQRVVNDVRKGKGKIKDCIKNCKRSVGKFTKFEQVKKKIELPGQPFLDQDHNGYTALEDWLHERSTELEDVKELRRGGTEP